MENGYCIIDTDEIIYADYQNCTFEEVAMIVAHKKGCPLANSITPKLDPAYKYRITHNHEDYSIKIEWEKL